MRAPAEIRKRVAAPPRVLPDHDDRVCLALTLYHEARDQPRRGRLAVAAVVLNRVGDSRWPDTVCEVVGEPWQFSYVAPDTKRTPKITERKAWIRALDEAESALELEFELGHIVDDIDHYHTTKVSPSWAETLDRVARIDDHVFYASLSP